MFVLILNNELNEALNNNKSTHFFIFLDRNMVAASYEIFSHFWKYHDFISSKHNILHKINVQ